MLLTLLAAAQAATYREVPSLPELADRSSCVVTGVVRSATTEQAPWGLVTTYEVDVERTLSGPPRRTVTFSLPGGRAPSGMTQTWSGVPLWAEGEEVLVVLPRDGHMPMSGVFTLRDHEVLDPLGRWGDRTLLDHDLAAALRER